MAEDFVPAKVGDKIKLTGKGLGPAQRKEFAGKTVTVTQVSKGYVYWKGGGGIFNYRDRLTVVEEAPVEDETPTPVVALPETGPHWYL